MDTNTMAAVEAGANYHDEEALLLAAAGVVASLVTVTAAHSRRRRSRPRKTWMRCRFQRRQSRGTCEVLVRELRDEDPELFRAYLRMDVATYDQLLELLTWSSHCGLSTIPATHLDSRKTFRNASVPGNRYEVRKIHC